MEAHTKKSTHEKIELVARPAVSSCLPRSVQPVGQFWACTLQAGPGIRGQPPDDGPCKSFSDTLDK